MNERHASPATSFPSHGSNTDMAPFTRIGRGSKGYLNPGYPTFYGIFPIHVGQETQKKRKDIQGSGRS